MPSDRPGRQRLINQLPSGKHGLPRSVVQANQRQRMFDAIADVVSFKGYTAMSVEDIVAVAGVSRRTFYDTFTSKQDAYLAAYDAITARLVESVRSAYDSTDVFAERVLTSLAAFLEFVAGVPRYADMCIVEVLAAGPSAIKRRNAIMKGFAALLHDSAGAIPGARRPPDPTSEMLVGGVYEIVYRQVMEGRANELPDLLPDLAYLVLLPYIGPVAAEQTVRRARAATGA